MTAQIPSPMASEEPTTEPPSPNNTAFVPEAIAPGASRPTDEDLEYSRYLENDRRIIKKGVIRQMRTDAKFVEKPLEEQKADVRDFVESTMNQRCKTSNIRSAFRKYKTKFKTENRTEWLVEEAWKEIQNARLQAWMAGSKESKKPKKLIEEIQPLVKADEEHEGDDSDRDDDEPLPTRKVKTEDGGKESFDKIQYTPPAKKYIPQESKDSDPVKEEEQDEETIVYTACPRGLTINVSNEGIHSGDDRTESFKSTVKVEMHEEDGSGSPKTANAGVKRQWKWVTTTKLVVWPPLEKGTETNTDALKRKFDASGPE